MHKRSCVGKSLEILKSDNYSETAAYYLSQKRAFFALLYKTRADTQQVLPVQTGL